MSTDLIKKMRIGQGSSSTVKDIGVEADNVEDLSAFLGIAISGEEGPITRLEGEKAYNELFNTNDHVIKSDFIGCVYKIGDIFLGALIKNLTVRPILATEISNSSLNIKLYDFFKNEYLMKQYDNVNNVNSVRGSLYRRNEQSSGNPYIIYNMEKQDSEDMRIFGNNLGTIGDFTDYSIKNKDWFWIIPKEKKQLSTNDFTNEYKNKIDKIDILAESKVLNYGTVGQDQEINTSCLYNLNSSSEGYTNQSLTYKVHYVFGKLLRLDITQIEFYWDGTDYEHEYITNGNYPNLYNITISDLLESKSYYNFHSKISEDTISNYTVLNIYEDETHLNNIKNYSYLDIQPQTIIDNENNNITITMSITEPDGLPAGYYNLKTSNNSFPVISLYFF